MIVLVLRRTRILERSVSAGVVKERVLVVLEEVAVGPEEVRMAPSCHVTPRKVLLPYVIPDQ